MVDSRRKSAWSRFRAGLARERSLEQQVRSLQEQVRRMERSFEEVHRAYEQYKIDAALGWRERHQAEQKFLAFIDAVMPAREAAELKAIEQATAVHRHLIRSFFLQLVEHRKSQSD